MSGFKLGRGAKFEVRSAFLWTDFGLDFAKRHFTQEQIDLLPRFIRGAKKGKTKGQIVWIKCLEGGYVYDRLFGDVPMSYIENRPNTTIAYVLATAEYGAEPQPIATKYIPTARQQREQEERTAACDRREREKCSTCASPASPEPDYYMNPSTGSVDTLYGWYPHGVDDGLVLVKRDTDGSWVEA